MITTEQLAIGAAAGAVLFWPQIQGYLSSIKQQAALPKALPLPKGPVSPSGSPSAVRAEWISTILQLHDVLKGSGRSKAADLCGQLCVELINGQPDKGAPK